MAYATLADFGVDLDTHRRIMDAVGREPVAGLIVHAAGSSDVGVLSIDVWESREHSERFFDERLAPAMATLEIAGGPPVSFKELDVDILLRG